MFPSGFLSGFDRDLLQGPTFSVGNYTLWQSQWFAVVAMEIMGQPFRSLFSSAPKSTAT